MTKKEIKHKILKDIIVSDMDRLIKRAIENEENERREHYYLYYDPHSLFRVDVIKGNEVRLTIEGGYLPNYIEDIVLLWYFNKDYPIEYSAKGDYGAFLVNVKDFVVDHFQSIFEKWSGYVVREFEDREI